MNEQKLKTVLNVLSQRGTYRQQPQLVTVAEVDFQFDAIFRGPGDSEAMVVVMTGIEERVASVVSKVRALSHTMLRSGSKRPLTFVMLVDQESSPLVEAVSRICRVVTVTAANVRIRPRTWNPNQQAGRTLGAIDRLVLHRVCQPFGGPRFQHVCVLRSIRAAKS